MLKSLQQEGSRSTKGSGFVGTDIAIDLQRVSNESTAREESDLP